jgi:hypothetical protein
MTYICYWRLISIKQIKWNHFIYIKFNKIYEKLIGQEMRVLYLSTMFNQNIHTLMNIRHVTVNMY